MTGLAKPDMQICLEPNDDPKKKLNYGWRLIELEHDWIGIDTAIPNKVVGEALRTSLTNYDDGGGQTDGQRKYLCLINIYFTCADCFSKTESLKISSATWKFEELPSKQYLKLSNLGGNI